MLSTKSTKNSKAYEIGLKERGFYNLNSKATGLFVPLVEEEIYDGEILEAAFRHYFKDISDPHAIILGCTHFPLISDALQKYFSKETILIHSGDAIVEHLEKKFDLSVKYEESKLEFFASENPEALKAVGKKWLNI